LSATEQTLLASVGPPRHSGAGAAQAATTTIRKNRAKSAMCARRIEILHTISIGAIDVENEINSSVQGTLVHGEIICAA
jgi:hypothetical protein